MTDEDKDKARALAIAYEAFWSALREADAEPGVRLSWNSVFCWARMLQLSQADCGIQLMTDAALKTHMERADRRMRELEFPALELEPLVTSR